jgi:hypothetical protein
VDPQAGVIVQNTAGVRAVCADAAHHGGEMDKNVGARVRKETRNIALCSQVILRTARQEKLLTTALAKLLGHKRAEKSVSAGNYYALTVPEAHL